ncbi:hypothetical protein HY491_03470 [Candidatus Woesearchaeota archaeon]|nr:hypothetical protein [Candidatus Woesearchaeota archaeon]
MRALLVAMLLLLPAVYAVPQPPAEYWGTVQAGSGAAPDGMLVQALLNSQAISSAYTSGGYYKLQVPADDPETAADDGAAAGDIIILEFNGAQVRSLSWSSGVHREDVGGSSAGSGMQDSGVQQAQQAGVSRTISRSSGGSSRSSSRSGSAVSRAAEVVVGRSAPQKQQQQEQMVVRLPQTQPRQQAPDLLTIVAVANGVLIVVMAMVLAVYLAIRR